MDSSRTAGPLGRGQPRGNHSWPSGTGLDDYKCSRKDLDGAGVICRRDEARRGGRQRGDLYTSADSGGSWAITTAPSSSWASLASSADGTRLAAAPGPGVPIHVSGDSGATWAPAGALAANWSGVATSADGSKLVAVAWPSPVYLSRDAGATWVAANGPPTNRWSSVTCSADGGVIVALSGVPYSATFWLSKDWGSTWVQGSFVNAGPESWCSVACSADGSIIAVGLVGGTCYTSADGGANWIKSTTDVEAFHRLACSADGSTLLSSGAGVIVISTNSGRNWSRTSFPMTDWSPVAMSADGSKMVAASNGAGFPAAIYVRQAAPVLSLKACVGHDLNTTS